MATDSSLTSARNRRIINLLKKKVQDKDKKVIMTKWQKAKLLKLVSKIKACSNVQKTKAKAAGIKGEDSKTDKTAVGINTMSNDPKTKTAEKSAKAANTKQKPGQKSLATDNISKVRKIQLESTQGKLLSSFTKRLTALKLTGDKSQDDLRGKIKAQPELIRKISGVQTAMAMRGSETTAAAIGKSQYNVPVGTPTQKGAVRRFPSGKNVSVTQRRKHGRGEKFRIKRVNRSLKSDVEQSQIVQLNIQTVKAEQLHLARRFCVPGVDLRR